MGNCKKTIDLGNIVITIEDVRPSVNHSCGCSVPQHRVAPMREPDGFDAHIDRPRRENYGGWAPAAERAFREDLAKYRNAERAVKACDWPTREPMGNVQNWPAPQRQTVAPRHSSACSCGCHNNWPTRDLRVGGGLVPVGSVVVDHTWDGEPIFRVNR